jgi:hypothetical protein
LRAARERKHQLALAALRDFANDDYFITEPLMPAR